MITHTSSHQVHNNQNLSFSGIILRLENNYSYMLVDGNGFIKGVSKNFVQAMNEISKFPIDLEILQMSNVIAFFPELLDKIRSFQKESQAFEVICKMELPKCKLISLMEGPIR